MFDVIISGGAMTGATLALALSHFSQGRLRIALIEKQAPKQHIQGGFDARCIALAYGTLQRLEQIRLSAGQSLWQVLQPLSTPIRQIHVSDRGHFGLTELDAAEFGLAQLGAVVELSAVGDVLWQQLQQWHTIRCFCPQRIVRVERSQQDVAVTLDSGETLRAALLVGADGADSVAASAVNIGREMLQDYGQTAIICNIQPQQAHDNRAFERFTDEGPVALLPMAQNLMTLVWCVKNPEPLLALPPAQFLAQLQQRFGWRLGKLQQCGTRNAYPLRLTKAASHIQERIALVGNAAQSLHPIAGQGFNLGLRDVLALAKTLSQGKTQGQDLGSYALLDHYAAARRQDQAQMIGLTDGLVSLFANNLLPLQIGRNAGLWALSQGAWLRRYFAKPTLGWNT